MTVERIGGMVEISRVEQRKKSILSTENQTYYRTYRSSMLHTSERFWSGNEKNKINKVAHNWSQGAHHIMLGYAQ